MYCSTIDIKKILLRFIYYTFTKEKYYICTILKFLESKYCFIFVCILKYNITTNYIQKS